MVPGTSKPRCRRLDQRFTVTDPGNVYGFDITYIWTDEGWLYLAGMKDLATKESIHTALDRAIRYRKPELGCIHHSDRGSHCCATSYQRAVVALEMRPPMSRTGNCYDNAPVESSSGTPKEELIYHRRFRTRVEAQAAIQEYIEVFYNRMRRHSALGNLAPAIFAENYFSKRSAP